MKCLITGASGYVGSRLIEIMGQKGGYKIIAHTHTRQVARTDGVESHVTGDVDNEALWGSILDGVEYVIHCASRVHVMQERSADPLREFRRVNFHGTINLARQCIDAGVRRFIYLSTIGVNGQETGVDTYFSEEDSANPHNDYSLSKYEAELGLMEIARESKLEVVIIRPPLIYGPNAPGNFGLLLRLLRKKIPLPMAGIYNKRSFLALDNLIDFIIICLLHPMAKNELFLISDDEDISTSDLISNIAKAAQLPNRSFYLPLGLLRSFMRLGISKAAMHGLTGNLRIDMRKAKCVLGWTPPFSVGESVRRAVSG